MIPGWPETIAAFMVAAVFYSAFGLPLARAVAPPGVPPLAMAPALGWAVFNSLALPLLDVAGFGRVAVALVAVLAWSGAMIIGRISRGEAGAAMPRWTVGLAGGLAFLPMMAIMPKYVAGGILLGPPIFDHVKIAVVDAILRSGLPVPNPFIGTGGAGQLTYYYLWHFSAAVLARATGAGGWAAEAAMTGFTGFASLLLVMGLALALGGRRLGAVAAGLVLMVGTARPVLSAVIGARQADSLILRDAYLGGWLNQAAWVPQHLTSACCLILAALLILRLATQGGWFAALLLGVVAAAGFESSIWIGGVAFAATATALGAMLVARVRGIGRGLLVARLMGAAALTGLLVWPFLSADIALARARQVGAGMALHPYGVLGGAIWPLWADAAAFWLLLLPLCLPALVPLGLGALWRLPGRPGNQVQRNLAMVMWVTSGACLGSAWLVRSTIDNNDLGWRAVLPAILLLGALAGEQFARLVAGRRWLVVAIVLGVGALGVPDAARMLREDALGQRPGDAAGYAGSVPAWQALRRHTGLLDRVANNPRAAAAATPWPVNIAWATLSDRPSCFAGWESVIAYGALTRAALIETNDLFARVFDGTGTEADIHTLAVQQDCAAAVVSRADGAWTRDLFSVSRDFTLAEQGADFRVYVRVRDLR